MNNVKQCQKGARFDYDSSPCPLFKAMFSKEFLKEI